MDPPRPEQHGAYLLRTIQSRVRILFKGKVALLEIAPTLLKSEGTGPLKGLKQEDDRLESAEGAGTPVRRGT